MLNLEQPTSEKLGNIINNLQNGEYLIPDFQRDYDWSANDIKELLVSIFSDYYIGNLLLWTTNENNIKALNCKHIQGYKGENNKKTTTVVLDGQQRLTSLFYAFFKPEVKDCCIKNRKTKVEFFMLIDEFLNGEYDKAFFYEWTTKKLKKLNDNKYLVDNKIYPISNFPIADKRSNAFLNLYSDTYGNEKADELSDKLCNILNNYEIPIIILKRDIDIAKVCDIFEKINSKGVKLSTFDLLNSILTPHGINLRTDLWEEANKKLEFIDNDNRLYILQNMSITEQNYCSAKYLAYLVPNAPKIVRKENGKEETIVLIKDKEDFIQKWNKAESSLCYAETILKNTSQSGYGVLKKGFLPYVSMLPIFAAALAYLLSDKNVLDTSANRKKLKKWWYYSIFSNNYSSAVESTMATDYQKLKKWFNNQENDIEESIEKFIEGFKLDLKTQTTGSSIYNSILNLIITNGATNFYQDEALEIKQASLQDHHIVPKAYCEKLQIKKDLINTILNRTLIYDSTNNNIKDKTPRDYINNIIRSKYASDDDMLKMFEKHFISKKAVEILLKENFNEKDYEDFINERENTIISYIKKEIFEITMD